MATKIDNHRLEVVKIKGDHKKNGFNYREVRGQKKVNVIHTGVGYDTYSAAKRAAKRLSKRLVEPLNAYYNGKLI